MKTRKINPIRRKTIAKAKAIDPASSKVRTAAILVGKMAFTVVVRGRGTAQSPAWHAFRAMIRAIPKLDVDDIEWAIRRDSLPKIVATRGRSHRVRTAGRMKTAKTAKATRKASKG